MATELHAASRAGDEARVARLIEAKDIDVNAQDGIGRTAFYLACREGKLGVCKLLKEGGANVKLGTKWNVSPLQAAGITERHEVCRFLIDECGYDAPEEKAAAS